MRDEAKLEAARNRLSQMGKTAADVARELGVSQYIASGVLAGRIQGTRGDAHKVAVWLGLKEGVIVPAGQSLTDAMKAVA